MHALHQIGFEFFDVFGDFEYCPVEQVAIGFCGCFAREDGQIRRFCHRGCVEVLREVQGGYVSGFGQDHEAFDEVDEFPHIAGPVVLL